MQVVEEADACRFQLVAERLDAVDLEGHVVDLLLAWLQPGDQGYPLREGREGPPIGERLRWSDR